MAVKKLGGLDVCTICRNPLTLAEILYYQENDGVCNECSEVIERTKDEIDDNIKEKN